MSKQIAISPLAHIRFEDLDPNRLPRVRLLTHGSDFVPWLQFSQAHGLKIGGQRAYSRAIGLFIDFLAARGEEFHYDGATKYTELFPAFFTSLSLGTMQKGSCPYDLWWTPRRVRDIKNISQRITIFLDWIADRSDIPSIVPQRNSTTGEQLKFWARWNTLKGKSLLGHLMRPQASQGLSVQTSAPPVLWSEPKTDQELLRFEDEYFHRFLNEGFKRRAELRWSVVRDQMISLLLHGSGLRISDALSLWIPDVMYDDPEFPGKAVVRLYDPHEGSISYLDPLTGRKVTTTRVAFLRLKYDMLPLSLQPGHQRVGAKGNLYQDSEEKYALVCWKGPRYARAFAQLRDEYLRIRPRPDNHPFLFVTPEGKPMTDRAFAKVHAAAIRRIGLTPGKKFGTTPHGHRHAYVYDLRKAGLGIKEIQIAVRHRSTESQEAYGGMTMLEVSQEVQKACVDAKGELVDIGRNLA
ncbi:site-specific integrase [Massilia niastensis]|uniref:site-specific integrase n=1 Tax=Massilia niastensis TaxID=544911 RepID=UPI00039DF357|nr:site-specific integrase [Massilia niastensis]